MFDTVLVANRGEIAVRIIRTLHALGVRAVAVYSDADADALHVAAADVAVRLGPTPPAASYLSVERILDACRVTGAQAVHPGYGFLSENATFARACADAAVVFVGPPPEAIESMGDKIRAKQTVAAAGVPVVPGVHRSGMTDAELSAAAGDVGYPLMVKATAGGGGKGMRVVRARDELGAALAAARREAAAAFGDDDLLLERYVERPRHIEVQVLADAAGGVVHLGERECSLQRRHQKVVEECPSPLLDDARRARMGAAGVGAARSCGYVGAGTVEFIVGADAPDEFFFLEMNTRLQVEHPVTEQVYGLDLVEWQLRVAAGERLPFDQAALRPTGWAVEARVYAEDPARGFLPTGGTVLAADELAGAGVRVDSGVRAGVVVGSAYDPMLAKVVAWGEDRDAALRRLDAALADYALLGVTTNIAFLRALLADPDVRAGRLDTGLIERRLDDLVTHDVPDDVLAAAALVRLRALTPAGDVVDPFDVRDGWRVGEHAWTTLRLEAPGGAPVDVAARGRPHDAEVRIGDGPPLRASLRSSAPGQWLTVTLDGRRRRYRCAGDGDVVWLERDGAAWALREQDELAAARHPDEAAAAGPLVAPMPGTVTVVNVARGDTVTAGQTLLVVEAMKMEHPITAPVDGIVAALHVSAGQQVAMEAPLALVEPAEESGAAALADGGAPASADGVGAPA